MKYVVAVSGGIDSVVLLDMLCRDRLPGLSIRPDELIVAHFDHGIRDNSAHDAEFVRRLVSAYDLEFVADAANLGADSSEESARRARYRFLRDLAQRMGDKTKIITAHHQDDLVETVLMNLIRGTSWRGLAPFWSPDILRPLINMSKAEIAAYAIKNNLEWIEDDTNYSPKYFRNRLRDFVTRISAADRKKLLELNAKQNKLRVAIEKCLTDTALDSDTILYHYIVSLPSTVAMELLRKWTGQRLTSPQMVRLLKFIKTARSGDICQPGGGMQIGLYRGMISLTNLGK